MDDEHAERQEHGADNSGKDDERTDSKGQRHGEGMSSGNPWIDAPTTIVEWTPEIGDRTRLDGARGRSEANTPTAREGVQRSGIQSAWTFRRVWDFYLWSYKTVYLKTEDLPVTSFDV